MSSSCVVIISLLLMIRKSNKKLKVNVKVNDSQGFLVHNTHITSTHNYLFFFLFVSFSLALSVKILDIGLVI